MDLQWLLPQQIEQILRFCQLSAVEDLTLAANILQDHNWNIENALNDVVTQNDEVAKQEQKKQTQSKPLAAVKQELKEWSHQSSNYQSGEFELDSADYHQLLDQKSEPKKEQHIHHSSLLKQQNFEYEQMGRKMKEKQEEEAQLEEYKNLREKEFAEGQSWFKNRKNIQNFAIKFRLPHGTVQAKFSKSDTIETVIKYVNSCLRDSFESRYAQFDLTQSHPPKSLLNKQTETLQEVFEDSVGEVLIVKELD